MVNFSNTADNIQYGYCIADRGRLLNGTNVIKLTTKLLKRSIVNVRMKIKVVVERNSNTGYTTLGFGNYGVWKNTTMAQTILTPKQKGEFIIECNKEFEYTQPNLKLTNEKDTILLAVYNNGGNKVDGYFEVLDYSISVTQEAPLIVESISATKTQTRYIIGEDIDTSDILVTALMSDDSTKTVSGFSTEMDIENIDDYGKTPLSIIYTEDEITNTATVTLRMYKPFLTEAQEFEDLTNFELHDRLGLGINIGNTLDSKGTTTEDISVCDYDKWLGQETAWGQPEIIRQNFIDIREKGFNTVRIPVTWSYNSGVLEDGKRYAGKFWLARVNEVVQIGLEEGLYIMINMHHEQPMFYTGVSDALFEKVLKNATDMWTHIADAFKYYNERLIFEGFNEVDNLEASFTFGEKAALQMNKLNQAFVNAVRSTGENNAKRILVCPTSIHQSGSAALNAFVVPTDTVENKLIIGVHAYPLTFTQDLENTLQPIEEYSSKYNLPVVITEWGSDYKGGAGQESQAKLPYGAEQRPDHACNFIARTTLRGIKSYWWDNGSDFTIVIRCNKKIDYAFYDQELFDSIIDGMKDGFENKTAFTLPEENLNRYNSFDNLFYERINTTTGESKYNHWSDICSDYIPVPEGKDINLELIKYADAITKKVAFTHLIFLDENKIPIYSYSAPYMASRYAGAIPEGAKYMRFNINSPHNNITQDEYKTMFDDGSLAVEVIYFTKDEITKVTLEERTVVDTIIEKGVVTYEVGDELNTDDITVKAILSDGTVRYIHDYNVDTSSIDMSIAGEKFINISYEYKSIMYNNSISISVGDVLHSISATKATTTYLLGDAFDMSDIVVIANYSTEETADVTELCTFDYSTVDTSIVGEYPVVITYTESEITKSCEIIIIVKNFDVNEYVDNNNVVIKTCDLSTLSVVLPTEEEIVAHPYVIIDANNPQSIYLSDEPIYRQSEYVVFNINCTYKKVNSNDIFQLTPTSSGIKQVIGDYYCNKTKHWFLNYANYDVHKWIGTIPS